MPAVLFFTYSFFNLAEVGFRVLVPPCSRNNQTDLFTSYISKQNVFALSHILSLGVQKAGSFKHFSFQLIVVVRLRWEFTDVLMLKKKTHSKLVYLLFA